MSRDVDALARKVGQLLIGPRSTTTPNTELLSHIAETVVGAGIPLLRIASAIRRADPEIYSEEIVWLRGIGAQTRVLPHAVLESPEYRGSPVEEVQREGVEVRCRLERPAERNRYPQLAELARLGATDYIALPLRFTDGTRSALTVAVDRPGGFTEEELEHVRNLLPLFSIRHELRSTQTSLRSLLSVYLGPNAARRVIEGNFRRGTGELLPAAIWYSDMRDFTALGDSLGPPELVKLLDDFFEAVANPIPAHGGEVLKFIGDAVLAIFPFDGDPGRACRSALAAAEESFQNLAALNRKRTSSGEAALAMGLALHLGEVMYGNIGAASRLDFTAIGGSVNEASRLQGLTKELGRSLLMSGAFARNLGEVQVVSLGEHSLRGVERPQEVFVLAER